MLRPIATPQAHAHKDYTFGTAAGVQSSRGAGKIKSSPAELCTLLRHRLRAFFIYNHFLCGVGGCRCPPEFLAHQQCANSGCAFYGGVVRGKVRARGEAQSHTYMCTLHALICARIFLCTRKHMRTRKHYSTDLRVTDTLTK